MISTNSLSQPFSLVNSTLGTGFSHKKQHNLNIPCFSKGTWQEQSGLKLLFFSNMSAFFLRLQQALNDCPQGEQSFLFSMGPCQSRCGAQA